MRSNATSNRSGLSSTDEAARKFVTVGEVEISGRRYVTADRLAATLGVTVRTLHRWDAARIGAPKTKIGKTVLYRLEAVATWLASRETEPIRVGGRRR
jgi:hypothetical protein